MAEKSKRQHEETTQGDSEEDDFVGPMPVDSSDAKNSKRQKSRKMKAFGYLLILSIIIYSFMIFSSRI